MSLFVIRFTGHRGSVLNLTGRSEGRRSWEEQKDGNRTFLFWLQSHSETDFGLGSLFADNLNLATRIAAETGSLFNKKLAASGAATLLARLGGRWSVQTHHQKRRRIHGMKGSALDFECPKPASCRSVIWV